MLTEKQIAALRDEAVRRGIDADELIAEAESLGADQPAAKDKSKTAAPAKNERPLYMYHLPFVTVNEVRAQWLGLGPIAGGDANAAKYAAEQAGSEAGTKPEPPTE